MTLKVEIDWNRDGDFSDTSENVTDYVRPRSGNISVGYGRDQATALAPTISGRGSVVLDNRDRRFTPRNTASPIYGKVKPARPVKVTRTIGSTVYTIFRGHTDDSPVNPDPDSKQVSLTLVDSLADFRGQDVTTALYFGIRTGTAIGHILDACNWPKSLRSIDPGATVCPYWWEDNTDALTALEKLVRSEGPPAMLTVGPDGEIIFRDRHHRWLRSQSLTSQQTWKGSGYGLVMTKPFSYDEAWRNIINTGTASVDIRLPKDHATVWENESVITFSAGETRLITVSTSDPFYAAFTPVEGTDYTVRQGSVTAVLFRRSGTSTTIRLKAGATGATVAGLRLRAKSLPVAYTEQVSASDVASIGDYGARSFPGDLPWCGVNDAEAVLSLAVALRSQPLPIVSARFLVGRDTTKTSLLGRDLSDRITLVESELLLNNDFYIESIEHDLTGEDDHSIIFGLEASAMQVSNIARTDTSGSGVGQGALGDGLNNPGAFLIIGSSTVGQRLGEGQTAG